MFLFKSIFSIFLFHSSCSYCWCRCYWCEDIDEDNDDEDVDSSSCIKKDGRFFDGKEVEEQESVVAVAVVVVVVMYGKSSFVFVDVITYL